MKALLKLARKITSKPIQNTSRANERFMATVLRLKIFQNLIALIISTIALQAGQKTLAQTYVTWTSGSTCSNCTTISGTGTITGATVPNFTWTLTAGDANKISGVAYSIGSDEMPLANAWETKYGTLNGTTSLLRARHAGNATTNGQPVTAGSSITNTINFNSPTSSSGWGFIFLDIDVDQMEIVSAKDENDNPIPAATIQSWFKGVFDASDSPASLPCWDSTNLTVVGDQYVASPCVKQTTLQNATDGLGAAGWFEPNVRVKQLVFRYTNLTANGTPSFRLAIAAFQSGTVTGTVYNDNNNNGAYNVGTDGTLPNVSVELVNGSGTVVATTVTNASGAYTFSNVALGTYTARVVTTDTDLGARVATAPATASASVTVTAGATSTQNFGFAFPDYGDAPDTGAGTGVGNYQTTLSDNGPRHRIIAGLSLGSVAGDNDSGSLQNAAATADDNTGSPDDEDGITSTSTLTNTSTSYSTTLSVTNNTGSPATLVGWVDFNKDGVFQSSEGVSQSVSSSASAQSITLNWTGLSGLTAGTTFARFRLSNGALTTSTPTGLVGFGEVEDHQVNIIVGNADVLLVKRVTEIQGNRTQNPNDNTTPLNQVLNRPSFTADDPFPATKWPNGFVVGAFNAGLTKPGDIVEYTVYFLNNGGANANTVKICDRIVGSQQFLAGTYPGGTDIEYRLGTNPIEYLTIASLPSVDRAELNPSIGAIAGCPAPTITGTNNGTVTIEVTGSGSSAQQNINTLPGATAQGTPTNSYGYFRFRTKVNP